MGVRYGGDNGADDGENGWLQPMKPIYRWGKAAS